MRVDLGGGDGCVPEPIRDIEDADTGFGHVHRDRVPEHVDVPLVFG